MSIAVLIAVHDGLVIAADSASTLTVSLQPGTIVGVANVYDNANKIFNLYKGKPIGCVTYGAGSIGNASIGTLIKDLRDKFESKTGENPFDPANYTMEQVADMVAKSLSDECAKIPNQAVAATTNIGLLVGGYSTNAPLGESWKIEIRNGKALPPKQTRNPEEAGINWGGTSEVLQRIVLGFSPSLYTVLASVSGAAQQPKATPKQLFDQLNPLLVAKLQASIVFAPMPIQDAIDLARFLVYAAEMYSRFMPGAQSVGGPIEIAAITKHEGFKWIARKHYYDRALN